MAISRLIGQDKSGTSASGSVSATYPGATTPGNLLIAVTSAVTAGTVSNSTISGWTRIRDNAWGAGSYELSLFYKLADGTETTVTANITGAPATYEIQIYEYTGNANPIVTDGSNSSNTASSVSSLVTGSITTTNANDLIFTGGFQNAAGTRSWSTATSLLTVSNSSAGENIVSTTQSGYTDTYHSTFATGAMGTVIAAFQAATSVAAAQEFLMYNNVGMGR